MCGRRGTMELEEKLNRVREGAGASRVTEYEVAPFALVVRARVPHDAWPGVWYSWLSLKGHLHSFHYLQSTYQFASREADRVDATFITTWTSADAIEAWIDSGYSVDRMLLEMGVPESDLDVQLMRDYS